jgi:hypothetical protein
MSLVTGLTEMSGSPAVVGSYTAAKPALVFSEVYAVRAVLFGFLANAVGTEKFVRVLQLVGVVFAFFLASEVDVMTAGTLIEAEAVHHIAFRSAEVVLIFRVVYTFVFFRFFAK